MKINYNIPDYAVKKCFEKFKCYLMPFGYGKLIPESEGFKQLDKEIAEHLKRVSKNFLRYQDENMQNVGMLLAMHELEEATRTCLADPVAAAQTDYTGKSTQDYLKICLEANRKKLGSRPPKR